ncbi:MAG TPA: FAD-dependent oxidoreductase [Methylocella sp.]|nr:FAD-dependent oxidoreductase [Methylocella sp.]
MLEIAIIGGGVSGLCLAKALQQQGRDFALFEARGRLGGRVLTLPFAQIDLAADLGPTWFWPDSQPLVTHLVEELGLAHFPQHDQGTLLHLRDADQRAERLDDKSVHLGARRLVGGMTSLVEALAAALPEDKLHLEHVLTEVRDGDDFMTLVFRRGDHLVEVQAKRVVLSLPPRLIEEKVRFAPDLSDETKAVMRATETWMAAQAKAALGYDRPVWREEGCSGSAYATHEQAVLGEIFDACDAAGAKAALGGFLALSPELRESFSVGLPILLSSQMMQIFGPALGQGELLFQDWATEAFTCSTLDRTSPSATHTDFANPLLRRPLWGGKLYFGGSETAAHGSGYLEGAIESARRVGRALLQEFSRAAPGANEALQDVPDAASLNAASLARFREWAAVQTDAAFDSYRHRLNRGLAAQQKEQLTQRAVLGAIEEVYSNALNMLEELPFDIQNVHVEKGRSALMSDVQSPFRDIMQGLIDNVTEFNATSCALSNFPDEHHLPKEYMQTIYKDIAAAWQEFSLSANALLLSKPKNVFHPSAGQGIEASHE